MYVLVQIESSFNMKFFNLPLMDPAFANALEALAPSRASNLSVRSFGVRNHNLKNVV
jgi:hypothetical protein